MRNPEISSQIQKLNILFDKASSFSTVDLEALSHWGKYLCVLSAGFIENGVKEIYSKFVSASANPYITNYVNQSLSKLRNPKTGNILELTGSFNKVWRDSLEEYMNDEGRREAIDSIMTNRHKIAHGKNSDITIRRVNDYFKKAIQVIEYIESNCLS